MPAKIYWEELLHDGYQTVQGMIYGHHYNENMTTEMMADHFGVGERTLRDKIKELGIVMKQRYGRAYSRHPELKELRRYCQ